MIGNDMRGCLVLFGLTLAAESTVNNELLVDIASQTCKRSNFCTRDPSISVQAESNMTSCCYPCSCTLDCLEFNNCCPDYEPPDDPSAPLRTIPCKKTNIVGKAHGRFYYIEDECPAGYPENGTLLKCVGEIRSTSLLDITIVWSPSKRRIYQNRFCASCNGADDFVLWQPLLQDCFVFMASNNVTDLLENEDDICQLYFEPDFNLAVLDHMACFDTDKMVDTCGVLWGSGSNDVTLQDACASGQVVPYSYYDTIGEFYFLNMYIAVDDKLILFKNVFCFLCNYKRVVRGDDLCKRLTNQDDGYRNTIFVPITVFLNLQLLQEERRQRTCANDEMDDIITGRCKKLHCQFFDVALNGECVPEIKRSHGLSITINFKLIPNKSLISYYTNSTNEVQRRHLLRAIMDEITATQNGLFTMGCGRCDGSIVVESDSITGDLEAIIVLLTVYTTATCSDIDIRKHRHTLIKNRSVTLDTENITTTFQTQIVFEDYRYTVREFEEMTYEMCIILPLPNEDTHFCSYVELNAEDYAMALSNGTLKSDEWYCPFGSMNDSECANTTLKRVCLSLYQPVAMAISDQQTRSTEAWQSAAIVSFVCTCLSAACLLTTIFTFVFFKELRRFPGGVLLVVSVNLLFSELLYVFGLGRTEHRWLCVGIGLAIHYFVLTYVFALNAYMILVYRKIRSIGLQTSRVSNFTIIVYIYFPPSVFIAANIVVSYFSVGSSFGYGGEYCFISSANMRRYLFALPIFVVVCFNCSLFGLTLKKIHSVTGDLPPDIQERRSNQWVYLRLSILTGTSWLFGFIHEVSGDPFSEYCFILLHAGQGFFVMLCFVCKRKVFEMYKRAFHSMSSATEVQ